MKIKGIDRKLTNVLPDLSVAHYLQNCRFGVDGEMRWRRGMAKSSIAVQSGAINAIGATNNKLGQFLAMQVGTTIEGLPSGAASWSDVSLQAPTISVNAAGVVTMTRATLYARSFLLYSSTNRGAGPIIPVGEFTILPYQTTITTTVTDHLTTYYAAEEKAGSIIGPRSMWKTAAVVPVTGYRLWYDADQITGLVDGDPVSTWIDLAAARNLTSTLTTRPLYRTSIVNGKPAVQFDGSNDYMEYPGIALTVQGSGAIFIVMTGLSGSGAAFGTGTPGITQNETIVTTGTTSVGYTQGGGGGGGSVAITAAESVIYAVSMDTTSSFVRVNGNAARQTSFTIGLAPAPGPAASPVRVGTTAVGSTPMNGSICEIIVYSSVLSGANFAAVETYLKTKYNLA